MTYPVLKTNKARRIGDRLDQIVAGQKEILTDLGFEGLISQVEERKGCDVDRSEILRQAKEFTKEATLLQRQAREVRDRVHDAELEELFARHLFSVLSKVPAKALHDADFWRFLALFPYRWYVYARERDFKPVRYGGDGDRDKSRWTLIRAYLWAAKTVLDDKDFSYAGKVRQARLNNGLSEGWVIDYYSNNVVRGSMTYSPELCRALIDATLSDPPLFDFSNSERPTDDLAQRVRRVSGNIYFPALTQEDILEIIMEERKHVSPVNRVT